MKEAVAKPVPRPLPEAGRGEGLAFLPSPLRGGAGGGVLTWSLRRLLAPAIILAISGAMPTALRGHSGASEDPFVFRDVGDEAGIFPHVAGIRGHGAAWGDVDGDGWPDLFVATFHNQGSKPGIFLRNERGKFRPDGQEHLRTSGRARGPPAPRPPT